MSSSEQLIVKAWPALPADVWGAVARATLHAEGDTLRAWERLGRVNSIWRASLKGDCSRPLRTMLVSNTTTVNTARANPPDNFRPHPVF